MNAAFYHPITRVYARVQTYIYTHTNTHDNPGFEKECFMLNFLNYIC